MRYLILSRHGNTFGPHDSVVWVGAKNDLPLVDSGIKQAEELAGAFLSSGIAPDAIYCGPLSRTKEYAKIVGLAVNPAAPLLIDERLNELDYGDWSGLKDLEIAVKFGGEVLQNWNHYGIWPDKAKWGSSEKEVFSEVASFAHDVAEAHVRKIVLAVTSNGRLRFFLKLFPNVFADYSKRNMLKVGTGKICILGGGDAALRLLGWNMEPGQALALIAESLKNLQPS